MSLPDAARGIPNASIPLPWLIVSGQPSEPQLRTLQAAGVETVIDLRDPMEPRPFDEPETVQSLGMTYANMPVASGALTDGGMDYVIGALHRARGTPTLLHCNTANRTGGPLLAYLMIHEGMDEPSAIDAAMRSGLRSAEYLEWARDYAVRHRGKDA